MIEFRKILETNAFWDVLTERLAQIHKHRHEPETDRLHDPHHLPDLTAQYARIAADRAAPGERQDLLASRKKAVQAAALALAAVERLDAEIAHRNALRPNPDADPDIPGLLGT